MNVLHLAAGNRWTGAAAVAFAEVEALRQHGVNAHFAYVGGYKLEQKLTGCDFAHALISRRQDPISFFRSVGALRELIRSLSIDIVHAHLTYDHSLACSVTRGGVVKLVRTFHSRRVLRRDPFTSFLMSRTSALCAVNSEFLDIGALRARNAHFTPPPTDGRQFHPAGGHLRKEYGVAEESPLVMMIGKLSSGRGFEEGFAAFRLIAQEQPQARLMVVGHGEHRPLLERLSRDLLIAGKLIWAGYHEETLAEHFRTADLLLFTAVGSDHGHRAVLESLACGTPVASYPLAGMGALVGNLTTPLPWVTSAREPASLASTAAAILAASRLEVRRAAADRSTAFLYPVAARRLSAVYEGLRPRG